MVVSLYRRRAILSEFLFFIDFFSLPNFFASDAELPFGNCVLHHALFQRLRWYSNSTKSYAVLLVDHLCLPCHLFISRYVGNEMTAFGDTRTYSFVTRQ